MEKKNILGPKIRKARKIANPSISQKDLVARLQVLGYSIDQSGISKIENGERNLLDFEVKAFAQALKVTPGWLFEDE